MVLVPENTLERLQQRQQGVEDILSQLAKTKSSSSLLGREFKISVQIGEPGQTEKLTFVSLMHQIDSGLKRDYQENEIVDAVIRAWVFLIY